MRRLLPLACLLAGPVWAPAAWAEVELGFYGGWQGAPSSDVTVGGVDGDISPGWEAAPSYGVRATWWNDRGFGLGVDLGHAGLQADSGALEGAGVQSLEFSDGLNILTINGMRRWDGAFGRVTPYVGAGIGLTAPEVTATGDASEDRATGPAVSWIAGASVPITDSLSVFGEYRGTFSRNEADLDGGTTVETDITTNSVNLGVSFSF